jgi:hypothetical protein
MFSFRPDMHRVERGVGMELFMELSRRERVSHAPARARPPRKAPHESRRRREPGGRVLAHESRTRVEAVDRPGRRQLGAGAFPQLEPRDIVDGPIIRVRAPPPDRVERDRQHWSDDEQIEGDRNDDRDPDVGRNGEQR